MGCNSSTSAVETVATPPRPRPQPTNIGVAMGHPSTTPTGHTRSIAGWTSGSRADEWELESPRSCDLSLKRCQHSAIAISSQDATTLAAVELRLSSRAEVPESSSPPRGVPTPRSRPWISKTNWVGDPSVAAVSVSPRHHKSHPDYMRSTSALERYEDHQARNAFRFRGSRSTTSHGPSNSFDSATGESDDECETGAFTGINGGRTTYGRSVSLGVALSDDEFEDDDDEEYDAFQPLPRVIAPSYGALFMDAAEDYVPTNVDIFDERAHARVKESTSPENGWSALHPSASFN